MPKDIQAIVDRSHNTHASYAVFTKVDVTIQGSPRQDVNAEFHQGVMHRVEVPARRVVANCETGEGAIYDVQNGRYVDDARDGIKGACGIDLGADATLSAKLLPPITSTYGPADRIELVGEKFIRSYTITRDGIILAGDYSPRSAGVGFSLHTTETVLRRGPQDPSMFTRESLTRAFAPSADSLPSASQR